MLQVCVGGVVGREKQVGSSLPIQYLLELSAMLMVNIFLCLLIVASCPDFNAVVN